MEFAVLTEQTRSRLLNILKIVVSLGGIAILTLTQDLSHVAQLLREMDWQPFFLALLLFLSGSFVRAYRWGCLVWALGVKVGWWRLVGLYFVGGFFSLFLPTGVGGDAVKMFELSRDDGRAAPAISSVLVDRFLGLFVLLDTVIHPILNRALNLRVYTFIRLELRKQCGNLLTRVYVVKILINGLVAFLLVQQAFESSSTRDNTTKRRYNLSQKTLRVNTLRRIIFEHINCFFR